LQAQLRAAQAALRLATTELRNAVITAPMSGIVSHRHVDPGAYINASTALVTLVDMQSVKIKVPISERNIGKIVPGLPAQIHVDAYPQAVFAGSVRRMSPTLDLTTRSADIEIVIDNADLRLKPGMFAKVTLILQQRHEALLVPRQAVRHEDDIASVFVVQDGKAHRRQVTMGLQNEAQVEILDNLEAGAAIVLAGHSNLKDQTPVTVVGQQEGS
jgi:membrane fusion protein (multidrug efflux system)